MKPSNTIPIDSVSSSSKELHCDVIHHTRHACTQCGSKNVVPAHDQYMGHCLDCGESFVMNCAVITKENPKRPKMTPELREKRCAICGIRIIDRNPNISPYHLRQAVVCPKPYPCLNEYLHRVQIKNNQKGKK